MSDEEYNKLPNTYRAYKIRVGENVPIATSIHSSLMQISNTEPIPLPMSRWTVDVKCLREVVEARCVGLECWKRAARRAVDTGWELRWMSQREGMTAVLMEPDSLSVERTTECLWGGRMCRLAIFRRKNWTWMRNSVLFVSHTMFLLDLYDSYLQVLFSVEDSIVEPSNSYEMHHVHDPCQH